ncbi:MAG: hypothetical protein E7404_08065 [Ruminococcaceae bacterium]|nr:hypothetical protein [Oscillospiraceae bacterium]
MIEFLKQLFEKAGIEVSDEVFGKIESYTNENFVSKTDFDEKEKELIKLTEEKEGKEGSGNTVEELEEKINSLSSENEKYKTDMSSLKFDHALELLMMKSGARNTKALKALLNTDEMSLGEDGVITGFDEQIEKVKADNAFLFNDASGNSDTGLKMGSASQSADGVEEAFYKNNPELKPE